LGFYAQLSRIKERTQGGWSEGRRAIESWGSLTHGDDCPLTSRVDAAVAQTCFEDEREGEERNRCEVRKFYRNIQERSLTISVSATSLQMIVQKHYK